MTPFADPSPSSPAEPSPATNTSSIWVGALLILGLAAGCFVMRAFFAGGGGGGASLSSLSSSSLWRRFLEVVAGMFALVVGFCVGFLDAVKALVAFSADILAVARDFSVGLVMPFFCVVAEALVPFS
jgi:hypothetical protein